MLMYGKAGGYSDRQTRPLGRIEVIGSGIRQTAGIIRIYQEDEGQGMFHPHALQRLFGGGGCGQHRVHNQDRLQHPGIME